MEFSCPRCGSFRFAPPGKGEPPTDGLAAQLDAPGVSGEIRRSNLSHIVRLQQRPNVHVVDVRLGELKSYGLDEPLPSPATLLDRFVLWIGKNQKNFMSSVPTSPGDEIVASIGASIDISGDVALGWLIRWQGTPPLMEGAPGGFRLTFAGWQRYDELRRHDDLSRSAFMAMKFDEDDVDRAVEFCFKPATAAAGFELKAVRDDQSAGQIDNQMRVALRRARFAIADLTHSSRGAYWEGGFAEGAGKPVIYTCRKEIWEKEKSHFDTNHLATIIWDPANLGDAAKQMTAMIRATLPAEAKMSD